jgi:hypothetical protein
MASRPTCDHQRRDGWIAPGGHTEQADVVMAEVVTDTLDRHTYAATLAERFRQESIHLRALPVELLDERNR